MSAAKLKAMNDLNRFAVMFSGVLEAAKEIAEVGSIEQAAEEAKKRADLYRKEEAEIQARLQASKTELDGRVAAAEDKARAIIDQANHTAEAAAEKMAVADKVWREAKQKADAMLAEARAKAEAEKAEADRILAVLREEIAVAEKRVMAANEEFDRLKKKLGV